jgi:hypothetical protein
MIKSTINKLFWGVFRHYLSDKQYARFRYWLEFDCLPDLENPQRFTEKIQYIKLNERTDLRKKVADRMKVRSYVAGNIGEDHLVPLIGNFEKLNPEIWAELPGRFVMKANHACKMNLIVTDKQAESFDDVQALTQKWQQTDYYEFGREWVYKELPRTIVIEELIRDSEGNIPSDFKFHCFHGKVEMIQVDFDRFGNHKRNLYDRNFNLLPAKLVHDNLEAAFHRPVQLTAAIEIAEKLSADFNYIRTDLYLLENTVYFGELTNYPANGFQPFTPDSYDHYFGAKWKL